MYQSVVYPLLSRLEAEKTHEHTLSWLAWAQERPLPRRGLRWLAGEIPSHPVELFGLTFPNVLGVAAGFDKDVRVAAGLAELGFGHVEVGTLTPKPQAGNARPRVFRLPEDRAIINRMGFPNGGVAEAVARLRALRQTRQAFVLGVSLGKQKETPLETAVDDYRHIMREVYRFADYLAINISSPNTPGLRELQGGDYLGQLLAVLQAEGAQLAQKHGVAVRPLLVKIAPDLTWPELDEILATLEAQNVSGIIATNTTLNREGLQSPRKSESGGLSGRPLNQRSTEVIAYIHQQTQGKLPIIGVGGVQTAVDVRQKLAAGASLVQMYTGLVYGGPAIAGQILRELVT